MTDRVPALFCSAVFASSASATSRVNLNLSCCCIRNVSSNHPTQKSIFASQSRKLHSAVGERRFFSARALSLPQASTYAAGVSRLHVHASSSSDTAAGAESPAQKIVQQLQTKLKDALSPSVVEVVDNSGDAQHVSITVVSSAFEGKNTVARHRMVYKAIWDEMQSQVHAVDSLVAKTPAEFK